MCDAARSRAACQAFLEAAAETIVRLGSDRGARHRLISMDGTQVIKLHGTEAPGTRQDTGDTRQLSAAKLAVKGHMY